MRSYVPKISSSSNICQAVFETAARESPDTLEQIFQIRAFLGYGFDKDTPPRATDIRSGTSDHAVKARRITQ